MGWTGIEARTRAEALALHLRDAKVKLGPVWRGDHAWIVAESYPEAGEVAKLMIVCIVCDPAAGRFYFKDVDESMGSFNYDCPEPWLMLVPQAPGPYAAKWRAEVELYWRSRGGWASTRSEVESARLAREVPSVRTDETLTPEQWRAHDERDAVEDHERDERAHRFAEATDPDEARQAILDAGGL